MGTIILKPHPKEILDLTADQVREIKERLKAPPMSDEEKARNDDQDFIER